jgi:hypothetical protein
MAAWKPENIFHDMTDGEYNGVRFVREALKGLDFGKTKRVVTSREPGLREATERLRRRDMPEGVDKWQLPLIIGGERPAFLFITTLRPNAVVPLHGHSNDTITRIVMTGSVKAEGVELTQGDWFYVPRNVPYSYAAGSYGATLLHVYNGNDGDNDGYPQFVELRQQPEEPEPSDTEPS